MCNFRKSLIMNTDAFEDKLIIITHLSYFDRIRTGFSACHFLPH